MRGKLPWQDKPAENPKGVATEARLKTLQNMHASVDRLRQDDHFPGDYQDLDEMLTLLDRLLARHRRRAQRNRITAAQDASRKRES
jgi:hypothetical protein